MSTPASSFRSCRLTPRPGLPHVVVTQFAAAVLTRELGEKVTSLSDQGTAITNALDMLISGV